MPKLEPPQQSSNAFFTLRISKRFLLNISIAIMIVLGLVVLPQYHRRNQAADPPQQSQSAPNASEEAAKEPVRVSEPEPKFRRDATLHGSRQVHETTESLPAPPPVQNTSHEALPQPLVDMHETVKAAGRYVVASSKRPIRAPVICLKKEDNHDDGFSTTTIVDVPNPALEPTNVNGAGATFPNPIYQVWFTQFHSLHPHVSINYQSIGSGGGIAQLTAGTVDFSASDGPMTTEQLSRMPFSVVHVPTVLDAIVLTYNLPGIGSGLRLTPDVVADIFLGRITKWNDAKIAAFNPSLPLPDTEIIAIHRADGSSATYIFTDFLSKVSPAWLETAGKGMSVRWPVGLGGRGNEGTAGMIKQAEGSIGYVELIYATANKVPMASVRNAAGQFITPSLESVTAAAAGSADEMPADFRVSITNSPGAAAYPIASFTWLLVPVEWRDANKKKAFLAFVNWMIDSGEGMVSRFGYAPLPREVAIKVKQSVRKVF
jgi:phosphate transport system substrate-binding protein